MGFLFLVGSFLCLRIGLLSFFPQFDFHEEDNVFITHVELFLLSCYSTFKAICTVLFNSTWWCHSTTCAISQFRPIINLVIVASQPSSTFSLIMAISIPLWYSSPLLDS